MFQYSLSESTYEYWEKIYVVSNQTGSIFDKVPAGVTGNINQVDGDSEVLGYFEVANVDIRRFSTTPFKLLSKEIKVIKECNLHIHFIHQPDYCCYCWLLPDNIPKPDYWGE